MIYVKRNTGYIPQLTGLKVLALLGIFYWHAMPQAGLPDLGARLVELFFVVSGFLVGFRNHGTFDESVSGCWDYVWPKVKALYPVYLLGLVLGVFQHILRGGWCIGAETIPPIVWALGLQQAWVPSIAMMYNGASWFISAWVFCMLCAPVLQWLLERLQGFLGEARGFVASLVLLLLVRIFLEMCRSLTPGVYPYSLHVTPIIRFLKFGVAYSVGVGFRERGGNVKRSLALGAALEITAVGAAVACVVLFDKSWPRWAFVLVWVAVIPILAGGWPNQPPAFVETFGCVRKDRDGVLSASQCDHWNRGHLLLDFCSRGIQEGRPGVVVGNASVVSCLPPTVSGA